MTLEVKKIDSKMHDYELKHKTLQYEHVLVYQHQGASTHAVYVEKYDATKKQYLASTATDRKIRIQWSQPQASSISTE